MNCTECQEWIATAALDQLPPRGAEGHRQRCRACQAFAEDLEAVSRALSSWTAPPAPVMDLAVIEAEIESRTRRALIPSVRPSVGARLLEQPATIALGGAAVLAAGVAMAPGWVQQVAAGWVILAAVFVSLVLVHHGRRTMSEGEPTC
jgi:hypothetical protein